MLGEEIGFNLGMEAQGGFVQVNVTKTLNGAAAVGAISMLLGTYTLSACTALVIALVNVARSFHSVLSPLIVDCRGASAPNLFGGLYRKWRCARVPTRVCRTAGTQCCPCLL